MISLDDVRRLMKDEALSDDEASAIRDACYELSGIVIDQWLAERWDRNGEGSGSTDERIANPDSP